MLNLEVIKYFAKIGFTAFGGPVAVSAQIQKDWVKHGWITESEFNEVFALIKSMPGPLAFQLISYLSYKRAGFWTAAISAFLFISPAFMMIIGIGLVADQLMQFKSLRAIIDGMQVGAVFLILQSLLQLIKPYRKDLPFYLFALPALLFLFVDVSEAALIFAFGLLSLLLSQMVYRFFRAPKPESLKEQKKNKISLGLLVSPVGFKNILSQSEISSVSASSFFQSAVNFLFKFSPEQSTVFMSVTDQWLSVMWIGFKAGSFFFGSGIAIVPVLQTEFVDKLQWISKQEFLDAMVFGQLTPGPFLITLTYIVFKKLGFWAAVVATLIVYTPGFIHMTTWFPRVLKKISNSKPLEQFLRGALAVICMGILFSLYKITHDWPLRPFLLLIFLMILFYFKKLPGWSFILVGGLTGLLP